MQEPGGLGSNPSSVLAQAMLGRLINFSVPRLPNV